MHIFVEVPEADLVRLDALARSQGVSRVSLIREAIKLYLSKEEGDGFDAGFGLWKDRSEDGVAYQNRMRDEW
jgi:uncharacterized protein YehS (DUF1456 family)